MYPGSQNPVVVAGASHMSLAAYVVLFPDATNFRSSFDKPYLTIILSTINEILVDSKVRFA